MAPNSETWTEADGRVELHHAVFHSGDRDFWRLLRHLGFLSTLSAPWGWVFLAHKFPGKGYYGQESRKERTGQGGRQEVHRCVTPLVRRREVIPYSFLSNPMRHRPPKVRPCGGTFSNYRVDDGWPCEYAWTICNTRDGEMLLGGERPGGNYRFDGDQFDRIY